MKKTLLFASAAVLLCGCGTGSKYVVEGDIAGLEGTVYLFQQDSLIDSAVVKSGKFRFSGPAGAPAMHDLLDSRDGQPQAFAMQLILEPGVPRIVTESPNDTSCGFSASTTAFIRAKAASASFTVSASKWCRRSAAAQASSFSAVRFAMGNGCLRFV